MHLHQLITLAVLPFLGVGPASAASLQRREPDTYAIHAAPRVLARIAAFRSSHSPGLTLPQHGFLDDVQATAAAPDFARAAHLKSTCATVFSAEECLYLLTGQHKTSEAEVRRAEGGSGEGFGLHVRQRRECGCATESDWCGGRIGPAWYCHEGYENCTSGGNWCGTLGLYWCNGVCAYRG